MPKNSIIKLPFDPAGDIFRWGPVPGRFLYVSTFNEVHYKHFYAAYGENWSETLNLFKEGRMFWINNTPDVEASGQRVFIKYMLPKESREKIYREWKESVRSISELEQKIDARLNPSPCLFPHRGESKQFPSPKMGGTEGGVSNVDNSELLSLWTNLIDLYTKFWTIGSVPELANYGSVPYLRKQLTDVVPENEISCVLEILTAPTRMSFYQEEEVALAQTSDIKKHQEEFFWLKNSYAGTQILPVKFFAERKKMLKTEIKNEIERKLEETIARKLKIQKQFSLPSEIMEIGAAISAGIGWQDERKKHIFIILHYMDVLVRKVARRFKYDYDELHNLWHHQVAQIIAGQDMHGEITKRASGFGVQFFHDCRELSAEEVDYFWNTYSAEKVTVGTTEVKGVVASKGKGGAVRGKIHILLDPMKSESFQDGEILVAPMTSPEYIFAMKKASVVITDTGGLTSHAAIVSRELGIPCLVGTKVATSVFKNGDIVEVDAGKGIARKI